MSIDIYIVGIFIILALIIKILPIKKDKNKIFINVAFLILLTILILREPYLDMIRYLKVFKKMSINSFPDLLALRWEKMYLVLNLVIKLFTKNERVFITIISVLGLIGPYLFIKRYSKNYLLSLMFYVILGLYNYNFYILRQALAISILLLSVKYIEEKSLWKFLLVVGAASCFHVSSIIFVIAYPICNLKLKIKGIILYVISAITLFFTTGPILSIIYKLNLYDSYSQKSSATDGKGRLLLLSLIFIAMIVLYYMNNKKELKHKSLVNRRKKEDTHSIFLNMFMIGLVLQLFAIQQSVVVRLANIFVISASILIPNVIDKIENKKIKNVISTAVFCCAIFYAFFIPTINNYEIYLL